VRLSTYIQSPFCHRQKGRNRIVFLLAWVRWQIRDGSGVCHWGASRVIESKGSYVVPFLSLIQAIITLSYCVSCSWQQRQSIVVSCLSIVRCVLQSRQDPEANRLKFKAHGGTNSSQISRSRFVPFLSPVQFSAWSSKLSSNPFRPFLVTVESIYASRSVSALCWNGCRFIRLEQSRKTHHHRALILARDSSRFCHPKPRDWNKKEGHL
jgi:hypothetical protein